MTENEKRYEDFIRALKELCRSHGVAIHSDKGYSNNIFVRPFNQYGIDNLDDITYNVLHWEKE